MDSTERIKLAMKLEENYGKYNNIKFVNLSDDLLFELAYDLICELEEDM